MRRQPEQSVRHCVVGAHLETFLAEARQRGGGDGLPRFVERERCELLTSGVMARGFKRFRCDGCAREIHVAFSCKARICPSCCGRRMGERAAHLVDGVLGGLPVRQWVLTLPFRRRYRLAYDHRLCRAVLGVFVRALLGFEQRRARALGIGGRGGAVTAIQRCGSALNVNPHFHTLAGYLPDHRDDRSGEEVVACDKRISPRRDLQEDGKEFGFVLGGAAKSTAVRQSPRGLTSPKSFPSSRLPVNLFP